MWSQIRYTRRTPVLKCLGCQTNFKNGYLIKHDGKYYEYCYRCMPQHYRDTLASIHREDRKTRKTTLIPDPSISEQEIMKMLLTDKKNEFTSAYKCSNCSNRIKITINLDTKEVIRVEQ